MKKIGTWLATLAIALNALWPLIANARPKSAHLVPVCTVEGVTHYLEVPGGRSPLDSAATQHDHCSFCFSGAALATQDSVPFAAEAFTQPPVAAGTSCFSKSSIRLTDARAPPFSPWMLSLQPPGREHAKAYLRHGDGALAAARGGRFMRIGVLLG
jgi:hypothetical protein